MGVEQYSENVVVLIDEGVDWVAEEGRCDDVLFKFDLVYCLYFAIGNLTPYVYRFIHEI